MRTWGSNTLKDSSKAGMSFGACGFNMAPALLLIFTRVLMLQTHRTQLLSPFNKSKKPYDSNHEEVLQFMPRGIDSVTEPGLSIIFFFFFTFYYRNIHAYIILESQMKFYVFAMQYNN